MRKLLFIVLTTLALASCSSKGIHLEVQNNSGSDVSHIVCYTVLTGDTVFSSDLIKNDDKSDVTFDKIEGKTIYNFILEFKRASGAKEIVTESLSLQESNSSAKVSFNIKGNDIESMTEVK